jgi:hypothetical protein
MSEPSLHDFEVRRYTVDTQAQSIVLYTELLDEHREVHFEGVLAHHFKHVLPGQNVLFDIKAVDVAEFVSDCAGVFADGAPFCWPIHEYEESTFPKHLAQEGLTPYELSSSYGMRGWVIAKRMTVVIP